ncbi:MAG: hypothetical protein ACI9LM_003597, partial [Alteromonadaceae bacterium]
CWFSRPVLSTTQPSHLNVLKQLLASRRGEF